MKKLLLLAFLICQPLFSHKVELNNGKIIDTSSLLMKNDSVYVNDTVLVRNDIKTIIFQDIDSEKEKKEKFKNIPLIFDKREELINAYSDFDGVILLDEGFYTLFSDGTRSYEYHFQGLVLKDSKRTWANFQREFDPRRENIKVDMGF